MGPAVSWGEGGHGGDAQPGRGTFRRLRTGSVSEQGLVRLDPSSRSGYHGAVESLR